MTGDDLAQAAASLVGTRFRLHGCDPAHGLDCIGLFTAAMARCERVVAVPKGYGLRLSRRDDWLPDPAAYGFAVAAPPFAPGDVAMLCPGPAQLHLAIRGTGGWVHAHAGLRRVVIAPPPAGWPVAGHWRLRPEP